MAKGTSSKEVDFGAIEEGGGSRVRVPEGDYRVKITSVKHAVSQSGNDMFVWEFRGVDGKLKGKELKDYTTLTTKSLWKLRDLLEAVSGKSPGGKVNMRKLLDYCKKQVGKEMGVTLEDDEYTNDKGKTFISSKVSDYVSLEDLDDTAPEEDIEDEDDADVEDDEDDDDEDDDELEDLDRAGLKKYIKDENIDVKVKKSMSDDDIRDAIREATEDDDDDEEEIEDVDLDEL